MAIGPIPCKRVKLPPVQALDPLPNFVLARWRRQLVTALVVLGLLKVGLAFRVGSGSQVAMLPLLLGADILGAACVATLAAVWNRRGWALAVQGAHAAVVATSTLAVVDLGGHLNRSFLGLSAMKIAEWTPSMAASTGAYFGPTNVGVIAGSVCLAVALTLRPPIAGAWGLPRRAVLGALVIATMAFLPIAKGGWIGLRLVTHDLEASPGLELVGSYVRPALRALSLGGDRSAAKFRFDWSSVAQPAGALATPLTRSRAKATNLVIILQESIGRRYVDHPSDPMPYVRSLMGRPDVVTLDNHHATWSLTTKSLFSLLCSEMPYPTYRPISYVHAAIPCASLSGQLHRAGWNTGLVTPQHLEFDRLMSFLKHRGFDTIHDASNLPGSEGAWQSAWGFEDQVAVDALLKGVAEHAAARPNQPFFRLYQQVSGHHPFIATQAQSEAPAADRIGNYLQALRAADDAAKATIDGLAGLGLLDDTLVVIVADHGEGHGDLAGRNAYEPVVRVPALMFGPQTRGAGGAVKATTSMIDLAPTLLALLDQEVPCRMQGRDLTESDPARLPEPRLALFGGRPPKFQIGIADGPWHYILEDGRKQTLYRIAEDRDHEHDVAHAHPEIASAYRARVLAWRDHSEALLEDYAFRLASSGCSPKSGAALNTNDRPRLY